MEEAWNEWEDEPKKELSQVTVAEFEQLCADLVTQKEAVERAKEALAAENAKKGNIELKIMQYLQAMDRKNYKSKLGTVTVVREVSYALPKSDSDRESFFDYLKKQGDFERMITVHSKTFNSYVKEKFETAKNEGRALDFRIPGVGEPSIYESLRMLKGK